MITSGNLNINSSRNGPIKITNIGSKVFIFCKFLIIFKNEKLYFSIITRSQSVIKKEEHPFARIKSPKTINNSFKDSLKELFLFINPFGLKNALIFN